MESSMIVPPAGRISLLDVFDVARKLEKILLKKDGARAQKIYTAHANYMRMRVVKIIYGDGTGYGERVRFYVPPEKDKEKQRNLVFSLNCGSGPNLVADQVRAAIFVRLLVLGQGHSGVRMEILDVLTDMLNQNSIPEIPSLGSIGNSGDLVPSSYIPMQFMEKLVLEGREGLALVNGTHFMTGISALALIDFTYILSILQELIAILFQCHRGIENVFAKKLHLLKKHKEQREIAEIFTRALEGSKSLRKIEDVINLSPTELKETDPIQDRYSLRCLPQILGPIVHRIRDSAHMVEDELNSVSDNPVIIGNDIGHGGHFDGSYVADAMNCLKLSMKRTGEIARAYIRSTTDSKLNHDTLPMYLVAGNDSLHNGLQGLTGLSIESVYNSLCKEAIAESLFTMSDGEASNQDIVSMGMNSALSATRMNDLLRTIIAALAITTRQAVSLLKIEDKLSPPTRNFFENLAVNIPFIDKDRSLHSDLRKLEGMLYRQEL
ncbi:hypothetical protein A2W54_03585 [Candidatus Giovannonibacteria bacterium RIFCSPHIGHO2_02_43_13]|uniref:Phenylalanine ammonia-lyase n=1 Tax=Candidatus Giovannonibacteria bacterium RIFCSPHIGHO2_02_43_13 TaxID=1798330 RepID=A0A1F5WQJ4_9BACT|nr:MAG: Histidine ammonia-lyase [Parcubacteria group bacterium GW2011_GWA2_44_13]OGF73967.1 MAG: hypothetical protein A3E06_00795 [Candidatus Giovannonibacteria bacterium RIFCSPHIGHO2_12_FULL_44_42]OGF77857.1 MAG: hypothetical protein A2W54_03585 [Candidatus Giovannonibacteria bacterium RIFCSPHIGHO2_02_43_13]OGF88807.1 MAG: hypothetical protein A3I94_02270 [Candidatus Giovannonibacteria bacterium RIFCSPLOWO2_02_FULL_43_54]OGF96771.1 MAG: hypothetical protein A3H08_01160 [Candidatus Giovannoniba